MKRYICLSLFCCLTVALNCSSDGSDPPPADSGPDGDASANDSSTTDSSTPTYGACESGRSCGLERDYVYTKINTHRGEACPGDPLIRNPQLDDVAQIRSVAMAMPKRRTPMASSPSRPVSRPKACGA